MSGGSDNQLSFIFPNSVYNYLNTGEGEISQADCNKLVETINYFDPCANDTLKTHLKNNIPGDGSSIPNNTIDKIIGISDDLKTEIKRKNFKNSDEINNWCNDRFEQSYNWLSYNEPEDKIFQNIKNLKLNGAIVFNKYFNFVNDNGESVELDKVVASSYTPEVIILEGGAKTKDGILLRLNLLKNSSGVPVLFTALPPHTDYLTKRWRGESATYSSSSRNPADCSPDFNSGLTKRHIKPWSPRERGSSASTVNAMAHLRRMATQPRITQVELGSLGPLLARGFMGGSMDGGAQMQLDVDFKDCESGSKGKNLSVRQSTQYADLFKSVVQRLGHHNEVSENVVNELKTDLEEYRRKECKLFQDAFRLANALKSQNNGSLPDKQPITDLEAFRDASDEVAKSETHLLGCLTKILTEACKKP